LATANAAFNSLICARSVFALARSSARSARAFVAFKGRAARMAIVARSVPAGAAAEAVTEHAFGAGAVRSTTAAQPAHGRRELWLLRRQALLEGEEVGSRGLLTGPQGRLVIMSEEVRLIPIILQCTPPSGDRLLRSRMRTPP
jgi:hypothetical protein